MSAAEVTAYDNVDVILPCLDEAGVLEWVLDRIPAGYRAIVVDNGSTDGSADIAEAMGALVVQEVSRGYGSACHAGLLAATAPVVAVLDCDGSLDPSELPRLVDPVRSGAYDLAVCPTGPWTRPSCRG